MINPAASMAIPYRTESSDWPEARKRVESYKTLPSEVRAERLRVEVRRAEESILSVTGDPLESSYWESMRDKANAELVSDQLRIRYLALSELFEMHCSDAEVAAVERQNARMLDYTEQMFGRTGRLFRYMLDMPREDRGEEIEVEGPLRHPKLDHIVFCYASHAVVTHKPYSIPDFIRLGLFEVRVEVKSQDFRQTEPKENP